MPSSRRQNTLDFLPMVVKLVAILASLMAVYLILNSLMGSQINVQYGNSTVPIKIGDEIPDNASILFYLVVAVILSLIVFALLFMLFGPKPSPRRRR